MNPGEVYALIGENGAGKSTLLNILSGVIQPDNGTIAIDGQAVKIRTPLDARQARIAMIHQELKHVPELTVAQNMFLGRPLKRLGGLLVNQQAQQQQAAAVLADIDTSINPATRMRELTVAQRQMVEIGRALLEDASIIAMDEPTSSLTPRRVRATGDTDRNAVSAWRIHYLRLSQDVGDLPHMCASQRSA